MAERPADAGSDVPSAGRRRFLHRAGIGGAALVGGAVLAHELIPHAPAEAAQGDSTHLAGTRVGGTTGTVTAELYGHDATPPEHLAAGALDAATIPPPADPGGAPRTHEHTFTVTEHPIEVSEGVFMDAWTYNGSAPGPILRATEGDRLRITVDNRTSRNHNLHLHGRHEVGMDGWEPIPPGSSFTYEITAGPAGVHPYHCHVAPLEMHIGKGMYGTLIVDPAGGRPPAHEFVLMLSGWDVDGDGRNELATWNGVAGYFHKFPIKVPAGELVRLYVLNMTEYEPLGSFHLHAQTFDVYRSGTSLQPDEHTDTITLGQGERAIVEFTLPERGRYMFHPHQHHLADSGAMGWIAAI